MKKGLMNMILAELFGNTSRIKILEELIDHWGEYLKVNELARMADLSEKTVYNHLNELEKIGILNIEINRSKKYKLNEKDKRALSLNIIESAEYIRKDEEYEEDIVEKYKTPVGLKETDIDEGSFNLMDMSQDSTQEMTLSFSK
jgi:DNA-binding transcriptional ArsR family regulator